MLWVVGALVALWLVLVIIVSQMLALVGSVLCWFSGRVLVVVVSQMLALGVRCPLGVRCSVGSLVIAVSQMLALVVFGVLWLVRCSLVGSSALAVLQMQALGVRFSGRFW